MLLATFWFPVLLIGTLALLSLYARKLTASGALVGTIVAIVLFWGGGWHLLAQLGLFFGLGVGVSRFRRNWKATQGLQDEAGQPRTHRNVLANAGVATALALLAGAFPEQQLLWGTAAVASLAAALSDTCSSELGNVWGRRYWNILSFRSDKRGRDGVISLEGTVVGFLAAFLPSGLAAGFGIRSPELLLLIGLGGFTGNLTDSLLGAALERKGKLGNHAVNFLNTLTAALLVLLLNDALNIGESPP